MRDLEFRKRASPFLRRPSNPCPLQVKAPRRVLPFFSATMKKWDMAPPQGSHPTCMSWLRWTWPLWAKVNSLMSSMPRCVSRTAADLIITA